MTGQISSPRGSRNADSSREARRTVFAVSSRDGEPSARYCPSRATICPALRTRWGRKAQVLDDHQIGPVAGRHRAPIGQPIVTGRDERGVADREAGGTPPATTRLNRPSRCP